MYTPAPFNVTDEAALHAFMRQHNFVTLVSVADGAAIASHVPVSVTRTEDGLALTGHLARANEHWRLFDGTREALAVFHGPHAYVSPRWYAAGPAVPTWNYAVVHVYGPVSIVDAPRDVEQGLQLLLQVYEPPGALAEVTPEDFVLQQLPYIVGFRMTVRRLEGKFKLSQNRSLQDRQRVATMLAAQGATAAAVAALMRDEHGG